MAEADAERRHAGVDDRRDRADRVIARLRDRRDRSTGRRRRASSASTASRGRLGGHDRQPAAALDEQAQDVVLDAEVVGDDVEARGARRADSPRPAPRRRTSTRRAPCSSRPSRDRVPPSTAPPSPARWRRSTSASLAVAAARMQPFCAPFSRRIRVSLRVSMSAIPTMLCVARYAPRSPAERKFDATPRQVANDEPRRERAPRFDVLGIHADVADVRIRERDDLPGVRRIGQDFLIAVIAVLNTTSPTEAPLRADRAAAKHRAVGERQDRRRAIGAGTAAGRDGGRR